MSSTTDLAIAELVIYILLIFDIAFLLYKHGKRGFLGWLFFVVFCFLRVIASAYQIHDGDHSSSTGGILNSIGVSALLMTLSGIVHEA